MDPFPEITKQITDTESFLLQLIDKDSTIDQEMNRDKALESLETFKQDMKELQRSFE